MFKQILYESDLHDRRNRKTATNAEEASRASIVYLLGYVAAAIGAWIWLQLGVTPSELYSGLPLHKCRTRQEIHFHIENDNA